MPRLAEVGRRLRAGRLTRSGLARRMAGVGARPLLSGRAGGWSRCVDILVSQRRRGMVAGVGAGSVLRYRVFNHWVFSAGRSRHRVVVDQGLGCGGLTGSGNAVPGTARVTCAAGGGHRSGDAVSRLGRDRGPGRVPVHGPRRVVVVTRTGRPRRGTRLRPGCRLWRHHVVRHALRVPS
ncbi:hypothetical protein C3Y87_06560 [Carbonactinospora thermoautotrophica]|nr:hypothetical protein [Carbonactinospora thermoautotrophica]